MKKFLSVFLPIFLIFCTTCTFAKTYKAVSASYSIFVNGKECSFDNPVLTVNGKTYLPLTEIAKALSVEVVWNEEERQVEITDKNEVTENDVAVEDEESIEETEDKYWWEWDSETEYWWDDSEEEPEEEADTPYSLSINWKWYFDEDSYVGVDYSNQEDNNEENSSTSSTTTSGKFVGSKSGNKYHLSTCHWADKIKSANKVYFSSESEAKKEDYEPCSSCIK